MRIKGLFREYLATDDNPEYYVDYPDAFGVLEDCFDCGVELQGYIGLYSADTPETRIISLPVLIPKPESEEQYTELLLREAIRVMCSEMTVQDMIVQD